MSRNQIKHEVFGNKTKNPSKRLLAGAIAAGLMLSACTEKNPGQKEEEAIIESRNFTVREGDAVIIVSDSIKRKAPALQKKAADGRVPEDKCLVIKDPIFAEVDGAIWVAYINDKSASEEATIEENLQWVAFERLQNQSQPQDENSSYAVNLKGENSNVVNGKDVDISDGHIIIEGHEVAQGHEMSCEDAAFVYGIQNPNLG